MHETDRPRETVGTGLLGAAHAFTAAIVHQSITQSSLTSLQTLLSCQQLLLLLHLVYCNAALIIQQKTPAKKNMYAVTPHQCATHRPNCVLLQATSSVSLLAEKYSMNLM